MEELTLPATLIGAPLDLGAQNLGVDIGPDAFRYQNLVEKLRNVGITINDKGNVLCRNRNELDPGDTRARYLEEIVRVSEELARISHEAVSRGDKVIALGGDHSINLGIVAGASAALEGDIGLIYLDAHGDMNTPDITLSGNIHGMHLAALMGFGSDKLINVHTQGAKVAKENLLHIGGNDFDEAEIAFMRRENFAMFTLRDLLMHGLAPLCQKIDELSSRVGHLWISLDLDVIDMVYAPGAGMPNRGGLTYREIAAIADYIGESKKVIGIDVVEYNPLKDIDHKTAELGIELIAKFLGTNYNWYTNYMDRNRA